MYLAMGLHDNTSPCGPQGQKNRYNIEGETTRIHFEHHGLTSMDGTSERSFSRSAEYALISFHRFTTCISGLP